MLESLNSSAKKRKRPKMNLACGALSNLLKAAGHATASSA